MLLNREQILGVDDLRTLIVNVPEWGGDIKLRTMSIAAQLEYEKIKDNGEQRELLLGLLCESIVDEDNKPLFNKDDLDALSKKSTTVLCRLFNQALDLNIPPKIEDIAKNS